MKLKLNQDDLACAIGSHFKLKGENVIDFHATEYEGFSATVTPVRGCRHDVTSEPPQEELPWYIRECRADELTIAKLKINIKSLAAEARFNRKEAAKLKGDDKWALNWHRTNSLRTEARVAQWLYAFIQRRTRSSIEPTAKPIGLGMKSWLWTHKVKPKAKRFGIDLVELRNGSIARLPCWGEMRRLEESRAIQHRASGLG